MKKADQVLSIIKLIRPLRNVLLSSLETELEGTGLSVPQRVLLELLFDNGTKTVPDLARMMNFKRQYIQKMVDTLIESDYLVKSNNPAHKKSDLINLTSYGNRTITKILKIEKNNISKLAKEFNLEELNISKDVLLHLLEIFSDEKRWRILR